MSTSISSRFKDNTGGPNDDHILNKKGKKPLIYWNPLISKIHWHSLNKLNTPGVVLIYRIKNIKYTNRLQIQFNLLKMQKLLI